MSRLCSTLYLFVCVCYHHVAVDVKAGRTDRDWQFHSETKSTDRTTVDKYPRPERQTDRQIFSLFCLLEFDPQIKVQTETGSW